jgi:hypothetical protein
MSQIENKGIGNDQFNIPQINTIKGELNDLFSGNIKQSEDAKKHEKSLNIIKELFNKVIKSCLDTTNDVIAKMDDTKKFVSFDNVDSNSFNDENPVIFIQVFLENSTKRLNVLADPYILVEGDPLLEEIQMYESRTDGRSNPLKLSLSEEKVNEKLFKLFFELLKSFLVTNLKSSEIAYAS